MLKIVFNVAGYVATISLASHAIGIFGGMWAATLAQPRDHIALVGVFIVSAITYYGINSILLAFIISAATQRSFFHILRLNGRNTGLSELAGTTVGMLFSLMWVLEPLWTVFLAFPAAVVSRSLNSIHQLETETRDAVESVAGIVDHRDPTTYRHSNRVAGYAAMLARELEVSEEDVELVEQAASVHDVGKIAVPDSVLLKPGALDEEERQAMAAHTTVGAEILTKFRLFKAGASIVLHHHENFDGSGYPHGLAGNQIPLGARIVAVADAFDAMTSNRPYRAAMSLDEAVTRLRAGAGTQWDPVVVGNWIRLLIEERVDLPETLRSRAPSDPRQARLAAALDLDMTGLPLGPLPAVQEPTS
jgi:putative nucleotidyltransferase with HDIG domain